MNRWAGVRHSSRQAAETIEWSTIADCVPAIITREHDSVSLLETTARYRHTVKRAFSGYLYPTAGTYSPPGQIPSCVGYPRYLGNIRAEYDVVAR
jgi:hypothetical protein